MTGDFFNQLEVELSSFTREGAHLADGAARSRRRAIILLRRSLATIGLAIAMAASLDSEFPATAKGNPPPALVAAPEST